MNCLLLVLCVCLAQLTTIRTLLMCVDLYSSESDIATELSSRVQSLTNIRNYGNTEELNEDNRPMSVPGMGLTSESKTNPQLSKQEVIRQIYLRRHIDELKKGVEDKNHKVEQCR